MDRRKPDLFQKAIAVGLVLSIPIWLVILGLVAMLLGAEL